MEDTRSFNDRVSAMDINVEKLNDRELQTILTGSYYLYNTFGNVIQLAKDEKIDPPKDFLEFYKKEWINLLKDIKKIDKEFEKRQIPNQYKETFTAHLID